MVTHEPKCVQWKRRGAERVARQISGLSPEQELTFWQEQTKRLKLIQSEARKHHKQPGP
ncbi:MAG: hypothetical protein ACRESZ_18850 [Methylococcales bacterium]